MLVFRKTLRMCWMNDPFLQIVFENFVWKWLKLFVLLSNSEILFQTGGAVKDRTFYPVLVLQNRHFSFKLKFKLDCAPISKLYLIVLVFPSLSGNYEPYWIVESRTLHEKWSFPLRISSVNVTKSAVSCGCASGRQHKEIDSLWSITDI